MSSSFTRALCGTVVAALLPLTAMSPLSAAEEPSADAPVEVDGLTPTEVADEVERTGNPVVAILDDGDDLTIKTYDADDADEARDVAEKLEKNDDLVALDVDQRVRGADSEVKILGDHAGSGAENWKQYALDRTGARTAFNIGTRSVKVAVVDTGVDAAHPDLAGRVLNGAEFLDRNTGHRGRVDDHGHGTHVAGIVGALHNNAGVDGFATHVQILPVKVLDKQNLGWTSDFAQGIIWAANNGAQLINVSLTSTGRDAAVLAAVRHARRKGALVIAAAGNDGAGAPVSYPAAHPETISVASTNQSDYWANFSSVRGDVDIAAPGQDIISLWPNQRVAVLSGTSMAAPAVTGAIASLMSTGITANQAYSALVASAKDIAGGRMGLSFGTDPYTGIGRIDVAAATKPVVSFLGSVGRTYTAGTTARMQVRVSHLGRPLANRAVTIRTSTGRTANVRTGANGQAAFNVPLLRGTTIEARTAGIAARRTTFARVQPHARVKLKKYKASSQRKYRKVRLTIARPARQKVVVQVKNGRRWKTVKNARLGATTRAKTYSWKVNARSSKKRYVRVKIYAGGGLVSRTITVKG
ncbi:S8 family serine peptidase [Aeromicrobium sp. IC_218]|uniref:S8 family serine peptidase n=1 Tax=Aeromicrobium sp. IC_218 TaxID=2545468 RepID=UPI00103FCD2A|nr:S8 family serine peptidase [Aeromicrobium sp. IC_218]TCI98942.1 hypothetical protein E0W78_09375 [Aeromicrobium sp. IC_218]